MLLATTQPIALTLALLSLFCWGSWSNSIVLCGDRLRFEVYYVDYALGTLFAAALAALTLGVATISGCDVKGCGTTFLASDFQASLSKIGVALAAGAIFNLANIMLTKGIQMCGLAVAFPLCIGTALVLGTLLTRVLESSNGGNTGLLFVGVGIAFVAVCTTSLVHHLKDTAVKRQEELQPNNSFPTASEVSSEVHKPHHARPVPSAPHESPHRTDSSQITAVIPPTEVEGAIEAGVGNQRAETSGPSGPSTGRKLGVCILGGLFMSLWSPLNALAQKGFGDATGDGGLSPYGAFFFFTIGIVLSTLMLIPLFLCWPLDGAPTVHVKQIVSEYSSAGLAHSYGLLGGGLWAVGTLANSVSGQLLSLAASYAIGQSAPMVSIFWGVVAFKEFKGAPWHVFLLLSFVCLLYIASIGCIALSQH